jgi:stage II sporulation protein D
LNRGVNESFWDRPHMVERKTGVCLMRTNNPLIFFLLLMLLVFTPIALMKQGFLQTRSPSSLTVRVLARSQGKTYQLGLEEYLVGVLAAEMPAKFHPEALKAQAVAARTVAIRRLKRFGGRGSKYHPDVDFSDDPNECQAWQGVEQLRDKWKVWDYYQNYRKIRQAVEATAGIIMVYNHRPIDAVYHSTCGMGTAAAAEVWQTRVPYLVSVSCGFDRRSPHYHNRYFLSWGQLTKALGIPEQAVRQIRVCSRTESGRVAMVSCGKFRISGNTLRIKLKLNSTGFSWSKTSKGLNFQVIGYGHGVGMCQYGADGMGKKGYGYQDILRHYYRGVNLVKIKY